MKLMDFCLGLLDFSIVTTLVLSFVINVPKYGIMYDCFIEIKPYPIFPWSKAPQFSASNPIWLMCHLTISLALAWMTASRIVRSYEPFLHLSSQKQMDTIYNYVHYIHCALIAMNAMNFANFSVFGALNINIVTTLVLMFLKKYSTTVYFFVLCIPVYMEVASKLTQN